MEIASAPQESDPKYWAKRQCLREPIPELFAAAARLDFGVGAHIAGDPLAAAEHFRAANTQAVRDYIESMWGKSDLWPEQRHYLRRRFVPDLPPATPEAHGLKVSAEIKRAVVERDGFLCRYCSLPVVPATVRKVLAKEYPADVPWGNTNASQHAAFQALWLQYDHVTPLSRGGENSAENVVVTCAACNFMKWDWHLDELGLVDPREREPVMTSWDGLTRILGGKEKCPL